MVWVVISIPDVGEGANAGSSILSFREGESVVLRGSLGRGGA